MTKRNLANPHLKKVMEDLKNGKTPTGGTPAVKRYKHPVTQRRTVSQNQRKAIRR